MLGLIRPDRCETCRFAFHDVVGAQWSCRRLPPMPTAIIVMTPQGPQQAGAVANFPPVNVDWNCGEWQAKPQAAN